MPVYTYKCKKCSHTFDISQRMSDDPISDCPVCNGSVKKVITNVGIVFKGSGFYVTDNKSKSNKTRTATETAGETKSEKIDSSTVQKDTTTSSKSV